MLYLCVDCRQVYPKCHCLVLFTNTDLFPCAAEDAPLIEVALMSYCVFDLNYYSAETAELDLDDQGGKMFLRVLLNLVMHNYPALVSGALQLLFRHFSQRREVLQAFKQVTSQNNKECFLFFLFFLF